MQRTKRLRIKRTDPERGVVILSDGTAWLADFGDRTELAVWLPGQAVTFRGSGPVNQLLNRSSGSTADVTCCGHDGDHPENPLVGP